MQNNAFSLKKAVEIGLGILVIGFLPMILPFFDPTLEDWIIHLIVTFSVITSIVTLFIHVLRYRYTKLNKLFTILFFLLLIHYLSLFALLPFSPSSFVLLFSLIILGFLTPFISLQATWWLYTLGGLFPLPSTVQWIKPDASAVKAKDTIFFILLLLLIPANAIWTFLSPRTDSITVLILKICSVIVIYGIFLAVGTRIRGKKEKVLPTVWKASLTTIAVSTVIISSLTYFLPYIMPLAIFYQAEQSYLSKTDDKAIVLYEKLRKEYPAFVEKNSVIHYKLGISYAAQKKPYRASASFSRFLKTTNAYEYLTPYDHFLIGLAFNETGKYYQARSQLENIQYASIAKKVDRAEYETLLAEAYFAKGKFEKAITTANQALTVDQKSTFAHKAHLIKYLTFLLQGKYDEAKKEMDEINQFDLTLKDLDVFQAGFFFEGFFDYLHQDGWLNKWEEKLQASETNTLVKAELYTFLAYFYQDIHVQEKVIDYAQKAITLNPDYLPAQYLLGTIYARQKDYEKALLYDEKTVEIDENHPLARNGIGYTYYSLAKENNYNHKQLTVAKVHLIEAINLDPEFASARNNLGLVYLALKKYPDALSLFQVAIAIDPLYKKPYLNIGSTYVEQKKYDDGRIYYKKALEKDPEYALAYSAIGDSYLRQKKYLDAISNFQTAQKLDPMFLDVYELLAESFMGQNQHQKAIDTLNTGLKIKPDHAGFYIALSNIYTELGQTTKSEELFAKGISLQSKTSPAYYYNQGLILKKQRKYTQAKEMLEKSLEMDKEDINTYLELAEVEEALGEYDEAISLLKRALKIDPENIDLYDALGTAYQEKGDELLAIEVYKKGLLLNLSQQDTDDLGRIYENLGLAYFDSQQIDNAIDAFTKAAKYDPNQATIYINLGAAYEKKGEIPLSIEQYRKAILLDPQNALVHNNLGYSLALQGNIAAAIVEFKKALELDPTLQIAKENLEAYQKQTN